MGSDTDTDNQGMNDYYIYNNKNGKKQYLYNGQPGQYIIDHFPH